jgi:hypothetical protein
LGAPLAPPVEPPEPPLSRRRRRPWAHRLDLRRRRFRQFRRRSDVQDEFKGVIYGPAARLLDNSQSDFQSDVALVVNNIHLNSMIKTTGRWVSAERRRRWHPSSW